MEWIGFYRFDGSNYWVINFWHTWAGLGDLLLLSALLVFCLEVHREGKLKCWFFFLNFLSIVKILLFSSFLGFLKNKIHFLLNAYGLFCFVYLM